MEDKMDSPWRKVEARKSLHDHSHGTPKADRSQTGQLDRSQTGQLDRSQTGHANIASPIPDLNSSGRQKNSPPSSNCKESTRVEEEGDLSNYDDRMDMESALGSSPPLPSTRKTSRSSKKKSEASSQSDSDDQTAGVITYVGTDNNSSKSFSPGHTPPGEDARTPHKQSQPTTGGVFSGIKMLLIFSAIALAFAVAVFYFRPTGETVIIDWENTRKLFLQELKRIKKEFPSQTRATWTIVQTTIKANLKERPDYPAVLLLLSDSSSQSTADCLATLLTRLSSKLLRGEVESPDSPPQLIIEAASLNMTKLSQAKMDLFTFLDQQLGNYGAAAILGLEGLHSVPATTLHAFADGSTAPHKRSALILTLSGERPTCGCGEARSPERRAEKQLNGLWTSFGQDKYSALVARVAVNVAEVTEEPGLQGGCPTTTI